MSALTLDDCALILESPEYTQDTFRRYNYPSPEVRAQRLQDVRSAIEHMRKLRDELKRGTA